MTANKSKNDRAWENIFEEEQILDVIARQKRNASIRAIISAAVTDSKLLKPNKLSSPLVT